MLSDYITGPVVTVASLNRLFISSASFRIDAQQFPEFRQQFIGIVIKASVAGVLYIASRRKQNRRRTIPAIRPQIARLRGFRVRPRGVSGTRERDIWH